MRIVIYLPQLESFGGVELNMLETMRALAARGHRISLFYERDGNLTGEFGSFCESLHRGPSPLYSEAPLRDAPRIAGRILAAGRRRPDVIFANNISELAWAAGVRALTRAPIVCHLHEFKQVRRSSMALLTRRVNRFILSSGYMRRAWTNHGLDGSRIEVVHPGLSHAAYPHGSEIDRLRYRQELGLPEAAYIVVYMGRLIPEKGVDILLDAWRALALPPDQARLVLVGMPQETDDYIEGLLALAPPGCEWLPMQREVLPMLQASDVLVLPSRWDEPFGRVLVEAMATGRPAVGAAVGGIPEILRGEFSRLLFPRGDSAALAERLRALQNWRRDDPALAAHCAHHVAENFSLTAYVNVLEQVFSSAVAG
ncbi:MAG TPA: glycosyltransferase family 4 protein [Solirubrobacteraceae bacterium]|nr:glycosyltransferase family 4 protein [Solirubrobacteraceae bacterium]